MSALSYIDGTNNSNQPDTQCNIAEELTSYATDANPEVRQRFGGVLLRKLKNLIFLEDILTHIHEIIAALLIVSEDKYPIVRASLAETIPYIFLQCHEHACPDLEHYLYDRLLQIVLDYLQDAENEVSRNAYSTLKILLDKYLLDKKRIEEKVCPAILCPIHRIHYENLKEFNINSVMVMGRIAPIIGPEKSEELFLNHFIELCKCKIHGVRRACAAIFPTICYVLGLKVTEDKLLELFLQLCSDPFWGVRKACAESVPLISLICSPECRRNRIASIVLKLVRDSNTWVTSATFKILGQFISSFAQPCITGLAYSYNGELLVTNPVHPDFRDHSDPQTLANYEHYLKMFANTEPIDIVNKTSSSTTAHDTNLGNSETNTTSKGLSISNDNITPKNIAKMIIENKTKLTEQITEYAWPKQKFFKNYVFKECPKYIDLDTGNNNINNNSERNIMDRGDDDNKNLSFVSGFYDDDSNNQISDIIESCNNSTSLESENSEEKNVESETSIDQLLEEKKQRDKEQQQEFQQSLNESLNNTTAPTTTSDDSNIFDNVIFDSDSSNLENNLHRRRYRRSVYSFWRKNTPTDLQSIIKKAIHDSQDNIKPPLPPPPPHPLKLPSKSLSLSTIGPSSTNNSQEQSNVPETPTELVTPNFDNEQLQNQQESESLPLETPSCDAKVNVNQDFLSKISSVFRKNAENAIKVITNNHSNFNSDDSNSNTNNDPFIDNSDTDFNSRSGNLNEKKDKNGNDEDEAFNEFNSYKFWHISPDMPLDLNIVGNVGTWNMKMLNDTLPTTNSSILDDDIVTKTSKFRPPTSFEQNVVPSGILEAYVTMVLYEEDDEVKLTCAYNFPAVVLTLGRSNWHILKSLLQYLCDDIDWKVRKTIALSINFLALILGKEIATNDLVPVYLGFFKDLDEVKIEAIRKFASFLKAIDKSKHEEILSNIGICLRCDSQTNWRIKEDLAKEVCLVIKMYDSIQNCDILLNLTGLTGYFLEDKVSCVREIAADAMAEIIRISNAKYKEAIVKHFLVDEFANSSRWRNRQTFLNVLYKYNLLLCSKNNSTKLCVKSLESPQLLSKTSSLIFTSSSSSESTSLENIKDIIDILHLVFPCIEKLSVDLVPNIRLLVAKYLVLLINVNGISDDLYESFLKIVRRLRYDEDRDVKEMFDSVDLLKNEIDEQTLEQEKENNLEKESSTSLTETELTHNTIGQSNLQNFNTNPDNNTNCNKDTDVLNTVTNVELDSEKPVTMEDECDIPQKLLAPPFNENEKLLSFIKTYLENRQNDDESGEQHESQEQDQQQQQQQQPQNLEQQLQSQSTDSNNETDEIVKLPDAIVSQSQI